jgi:hypothetical protein
MSTYTNTRPLWYGVLLAPFAPPLLQMFLQITQAYMARGFSQIYYPQMELALTFGVPFILALRRFKALSWIAVTGGATVAGAVALVLFFGLIGWPKQSFVMSAAHGAMLGCSSGLMFCVVVGLKKTENEEEFASERLSDVA